MEGLRELTIAVDRISIPLRVVVFFLMTVGFILKIKRAEFVAEAVLPIMATSVIILGFIASQDWWFKQTQGVFFTIAHKIKADYETNPYESIQALKETKQEQERNEGFGHLIKNIKASLLEAFLNSFMYILIALASGLQVIFVCIYSILIEVFRLLFPLALACYQFDSLRSLGFNFVSKALSVMAWPVGFALIERIAQALQAHFYHSNSAFDSLHGGIFFPVLVAILVIGGTLVTPQLMSSLFTAGDISGSATGFARNALSVMQGVRGIATRSLVGNLSRLGSVQGLARAGASVAAFSPKITRPTASESTGIKSMNNGFITYANPTGASQIKFPEVSSGTTKEGDSITNKPLNTYAISNETASSLKESMAALSSAQGLREPQGEKTSNRSGNLSKPLKEDANHAQRAKAKGISPQDNNSKANYTAKADSITKGLIKPLSTAIS
jgi:hypothetical protein